VDTAILVSTAGASGPLRGLIDRLASIGVAITVVEELAAAVEQSAVSPRPPAVLLDLRDAGTSDDDEHATKVAEAVHHALEALPHALPIVVAAGASAQLIAAAIRAGAGDVLDVMMEGTAAARAVVQRICQRQADRHLELSMMEEQRAFIQEVLKDLILTERRAIDAEDELAARARTSREIPLIDTRPLGVLLVESERRVADELAERIEAEGLAAFAYVSGEEALRETAMLAETGGLDLAVVAARLPGMPGLDTIRTLRDRTAGLPAFLLTSVGEEDLATPASDLGVIAVVQKPIASMEELVERITEVARESRHRTREAAYLQRIKERHEHILERYRSLLRTS
jgi:FixJ family two-component response regulator